VRCRSCGYDNRADSVFCGQCRAALARPCPACGEPVPVGAEACPACAASLTGIVPSAGAPWRGAPGEAAAAYDPLDFAGAGAADRSGWAHGGETGFTGVARDVQQRQHGEHGGLLRVDFRIERHDPSGNRLAPVPVEMEGTTQEFSGTVSNGDEIRVVDGNWRDGTLRVRELDNLTTGARVRSSRYTEAQIRRVRIGCLIAFLVIATTVLIIVLTSR